MTLPFVAQKHQSSYSKPATEGSTVMLLNSIALICFNVIYTRGFVLAQSSGLVLPIPALHVLSTQAVFPRTTSAEESAHFV